MGGPVLLIIAGPNGSGKSTLIDQLVRSGVDLGEYINADDIAKTLTGDDDDEVSLRAQKIADERRLDCLKRKVSFSFETVMSHPSKIAFLHRARRHGYTIILYFVGLEDPRLNVARVEQRVILGGHPVPEDRIVARYHRTMALLPQAIKAADRAVIFDNSYAVDNGFGAAFIPVLEISGRKEDTVYTVNDKILDILLHSGLPNWLRPAIKRPPIFPWPPPASRRRSRSASRH